MNISSKAQIQQFLDKGLYDHHFQPIINFQNLKVLGYESLIRSKHHLESPESLFNNAKKLNKLFELDVISITMAIQSFNNEFDPVPIDTYLFLNIYPSTLASPKFINILFSRVEKDSLLPNRLILEINESEHIENYFKLKENIFELQSLGLQIALDDFDKGTTPFKRIIELEPNYIKLDKYFATNLAQSINKQNMLKLLIKYCLSNNIKIILEGIETNDDLIVAKSLGVQFGQGFLFGKPDYINNFVAGRDKNGQHTILFILIFFGVLVISLVVILRYRKKLNEKNTQFKKITNKLDELENKLKDKEKRKSFRLRVELEKCEFQILKIGDKKIDKVKDHKGPGIIKDISSTGLRLESIYDLPIKDIVEVKLEFELDECELELKGLLIRKEEHIQKKNFIYGIKFIDTDTKTKNELNKLLRTKELESKRKKLQDGRTIQA